MKNWNWKNWNVKNWFNGGLVKVIAEADKIIDEQGQEIKYYKELIQKHEKLEQDWKEFAESLEQDWKQYAESLERELKAKEHTIATYSSLYNKVVDEIDILKEQLKEYDELIEEDE